MNLKFFNKVSLLHVSMVLPLFAFDFSAEELNTIQRKIQYRFQSQAENQLTLRSVFTHPSYINEANNLQTSFERLENIGDALLKMVVSDYYYQHNPEATPAVLSQLSEAKIKNEHLAKVFKSLGLNSYIKANQETLNTGAYTIYADAMEAMIGAIRNDSLAFGTGIENAKRFIETFIIPDYTSQTVAINQSLDQISEHFPATYSESVTINSLSKKQVSERRKKAEGGNQDAALELAWHYYQKESHQEAQKWLNQCISDESWYKRGCLSESNFSGHGSFFGTPESCFQEVLRLNKDYTRAKLKLADIYLKKLEQSSYSGCDFSKVIEYYRDVAYDTDSTISNYAKSILIKLCKISKQSTAPLYMRSLNDYTQYRLNIWPATHGNLESIRVIARLLHEKKVTLNGGNEDKSVFDWYKKAATYGEAEDIFKLAECYENGHGTTINTNIAESLYQRAAAMNHPQAQQKLHFQVALARGNEFYAKGEYGEAFYWFTESSKQNNPDAFYWLARMYRYGLGCDKNEGESKSFYVKAAQAGHVRAIYELALIREFGSIDSLEKQQKRMFAQHVLSDKLNGYSSYSFSGISYDVSRKFSEYINKLQQTEWYRSSPSYSSWGNDRSEALKSYEGLSAKDYEDSAFRSGAMYWGEDRGRRNVSKSIEYFSKAEQLGDPKAMTYLGMIYLKSEGGVTADNNRAVEYLRRAGDFNEPHAMFLLALLYAERKVSIPDAEKEIKNLLERAIAIVH